MPGIGASLGSAVFLGCVVVGWTAAPLSAAQDATTDALVAIEGQLADGAYGAAMGSAMVIEPESKRNRQEALILYQARSFDAALDRALAAIEAGERDETLLAFATNAAIWIRDTAAGEFCQELLEQRLAEMEPVDVANWEEFVRATGVDVAQMAAEDASTAAAVSRARTTALSVLGLSLLILALARFRSGS